MSQSTQGKRTGNLAFRFFSNASAYALGSALVKFGAFFVLPLYWSVLTPEDFGRIAIVQLVTQLLLSFLDMGISGGLQRHFFEWKKEERAHHLAAIWSFSFGYSVIVCAVLSLFAAQVCQLFEVSISNQLIYFAIWTAFFQNFGILPLSLFRIREQMKLFSLISIGQFIVQTGVTLILLFVMNYGFLGYLWGILLGAVVYGMSCLVYIARQIEFPWRWWHLRDVLAYALPTLPGTVLEGVTSVLDRFFLQKVIPLAELGHYSLARQFGQAYNFVVATLKSSWVPLAYRLVVERPDADKVLARLSNYYFLVLLLPAVYIAIISGELIVLINNPDYFPVGKFIPWFVLGVFITGVGNIYGRGIDLAKKTQYYWIMYAGQLVTSCYILFNFTSEYGVWGAIASVVLGNLVREIIQIGLAFKFYPRPVELKKIGVSIIIQILCMYFVFSLQISQVWVSIFAKSGIFLVFALLNLALVLGREGLQIVIERSLKKIRRRSPI